MSKQTELAQLGDVVTVDQTNNRVGIGTSNPIADFSLVDSSTGSGMEFQPELTTDTNRLTNYDRGDNAYKKFRLDASEQQFYISGSERMRLTNDGLTFNGDTAAANALDDYEEGSWTPAFLYVSAPTYATQIGKYTKIGNVVNCTMEIVVSSGMDTSDGSGVTIGGLPFATVVAQEAALASLGRYTSILSSKASSVSAFRLASDSFILLEGSNDNITYSNCASSGVLQMAFTYRSTT